MKKLSLLLAAGLFASGTISAQTKWKLDKSHSNVIFTVDHMVVSEVDGTGKNLARPTDFPMAIMAG